MEQNNRPKHFKYKAAVLSLEDVHNIESIVKKYEITGILSDVDGILLETNMKIAKASLNWSEKLSMGKHILQKWERPNKTWLFSKLHEIDRDNKIDSKIQVYNEALALPPIMCQWQVGFYQDSNKAMKDTMALINTAHADSKISANEARMLRGFTKLTYDRELFTKTRQPTAAAVEFVELMERLNLKRALVTNFALDQFDDCFKTFSIIFKYFASPNLKIVSAVVKMVKPNPNIYIYAVISAGLSLEKTLFVDDEPNNILGALEANIAFAYMPEYGLVLLEDKEKFKKEFNLNSHQ